MGRENTIGLTAKTDAKRQGQPAMKVLTAALVISASAACASSPPADLASESSRQESDADWTIVREPDDASERDSREARP
jgi:hypothetical protein